MKNNDNNLIAKYKKAKAVIKKYGYSDEIKWQQERSFEKLYEWEFLQEASWVILSSGMKESIVRLKFDELASIFFYWSNTELIVHNRNRCKKKALSIFNHEKKIESIIRIAEMVHKNGFENIKNNIRRDELDYLETLPYIGPITRYHLAKNIGLNVVKPDRHLVRIAATTNHPTAYDLCNEISKHTKDSLNVIDLVLWRFATCERKYVEYFSTC